MDPIYRHRQVGALTVVAIGAALLFMAYNWTSVAAEPAARTVFSVVGLVLVAALYLLGSLTVVVDAENVFFWFGPGLIRKRFPVKRIMEAKAVRNPWWYGWGIRVIPGGWLYNVSGLDAVELLMGDGSRVRIGTDQPRALLDAINRARASR